MTTPDLIAQATQFRDLNQAGGLLLPNAWDGASARIFAAAGFPAVGTTSSGIGYARGVSGGERLGRAAMMQEVAMIAGAVAVPVTADIEAGYGPDEDHVAMTIAAVLDAGAVGVNLEDRDYAAGPAALFASERQAARIAVARATAERRGVSLVINARTDTFILGLGADDKERLAMTIDRGRAYLAAGADLVFVPVVVDLALVRRLADGLGGPLSLMAMPGAPAAAELFAAGAHRVSLGQTAMLTMLGGLRAIAENVRDTGRWEALERDFYGFTEAEALFADH